MSENRTTGSVLRSDQVPEYDRWRSPPVDGTSAQGGALAVANLEAIQQAAYEEAFAQGLEEGRRAGAAQVAETVQQFTQALDALSEPFSDLDDDVSDELLRLAMRVAGNIVRRELRTDPTHVIGVVRDALGALPIASRDVRVELHPDDAEIVRKHLAPADGERAWRLVENPVFARGGCRVETDTSRVDASVEARLASILAAISGDQREDDS